MEHFNWKKTIRINLKALRFGGLWPKAQESFKLDWYLLYSLFVTVIIITGHNLSQVINVLYVYDDLEALTETIFVAATNTFAIIKRYLFMKNTKHFKNLFGILNSGDFRPKNEKHLKCIELSLKDWKKMYIYFSTVAYSWVTTLVLLPILSGGLPDYKLPFEAWYPFDAKKHPYYVLAYVYQGLGIWYIVIANLNLDIFVYAFIMFIGIQCDMLKEDIRSIEPSSFDENIVYCIKRHQEILIFAENINKISELIIFGQIMTSTASLALSMFQLSVADFSTLAAYSKIGYISGMLAEIFFYCWFGNVVEVKSREINYAIFESQWIAQSENVLKNLLIFSRRCQKPINLTAMNLFTFSLHTFISILQSAWSYYALLSTVNSK